MSESRPFPTSSEGGMEVEDALTQALRSLGTDAFRDGIIDRHPYYVDCLIRRYRRAVLPRPMEIQITTNLDNGVKMRAFLSAPPICAGAIRLYLEVWGKFVTSYAANMVVSLLERWRTQSPVTEETMFLRVGPKGKWMGDLLSRRIARIADLWHFRRPDRRLGAITGIEKGVVRVRVASGADVEIPIRLFPPTARNFLRQAQDEGRLPDGVVLSLLDGAEDRSGVPGFYPRFEDSPDDSPAAKQAADAAREAKRKDRAQRQADRLWRKAERKLERRTAQETSETKQPAEKNRQRLETERRVLVNERIPAFERRIGRIRDNLARALPENASCLHDHLAEKEKELEKLRRRLGELDKELGSAETAA